MEQGPGVSSALLNNHCGCVSGNGVTYPIFIDKFPLDLIVDISLI